MAQMNDFQCWAEQLKKREPWYAGVSRAMPPFKTSKYNLYFPRLPFFWMHLRFLLAFIADQGFLRWRFTRDRAKMSALDALAKRLVPRTSKQCASAAATGVDKTISLVTREDQSRGLSKH
jgi:hypothetical protein